MRGAFAGRKKSLAFISSLELSRTLYLGSEGCNCSLIYLPPPNLGPVELGGRFRRIMSLL